MGWSDLSLELDACAKPALALVFVASGVVIGCAAEGRLNEGSVAGGELNPPRAPAGEETLENTNATKH
jgi:hypothetical protein